MQRSNSAAQRAAAASAARIEQTPNALIVEQLMDMGFTENSCKRAAIATRNRGSQEAMEWVFEHGDDPDFNDPI
jgi:ubiquitin carboxyl-terminal hydrolase 5/13